MKLRGKQRQKQMTEHQDGGYENKNKRGKHRQREIKDRLVSMCVHASQSGGLCRLRSYSNHTARLMS